MHIWWDQLVSKVFLKVNLLVAFSHEIFALEYFCSSPCLGPKIKLCMSLNLLVWRCLFVRITYATSRIWTECMHILHSNHAMLNENIRHITCYSQNSLLPIIEIMFFMVKESGAYRICTWECTGRYQILMLSMMFDHSMESVSWWAL